MSPENVGKHFERLQNLTQKYDNCDPKHILNFEESGVSINGMKLDRSKFSSKARCARQRKEAIIGVGRNENL